MKYDDAVCDGGGGVRLHVFCLDVRGKFEEGERWRATIALVREIRDRIVDTKDLVRVHVITDEPGPRDLLLGRILLVGVLSHVPTVRLYAYIQGLPTLSDKEVASAALAAQFLQERGVEVCMAPDWKEA